MNILLTGGLGFVGSHLVRALLPKHTLFIIDKFNEHYPGYAQIHRGSKGLQPVNDIEARHRKLNWEYRQELLVDFPDAEINRYWTYEWLPDTQYKNFDLVINAGALSEAILSQYYKKFCKMSIVESLTCIKESYDCPVLHFSSSMVYGSWEGAVRETAQIAPESFYGECKAESESLCDSRDIILRPIHIFGMGDGKFSIWMNLERQLAVGKPLNVEAADCIYIKELVPIIEKIVDNWQPGTYNISSEIIRDGRDIQAVYPTPFECVNKLGPTGKPRGSLDSSKLRKTFDITPMYNDYKQMIEDYYKEYVCYSQG